MQNEIALPYYLQQHEFTKTQLINFLKYQFKYLREKFKF